MLLLPPGVAPSSVSLVSVDVDDAPGVLVRVLGVCQRRGVRVLAMTYGGSRIELALEADARRLALVCAKLEAAIDVRAVSRPGEPRDQRALVRPEPGRLPGGGVRRDPVGA